MELIGRLSASSVVPLVHNDDPHRAFAHIVSVPIQQSHDSVPLKVLFVPDSHLHFVRDDFARHDLHVIPTVVGCNLPVLQRFGLPTSEVVANASLCPVRIACE